MTLGQSGKNEKNGRFHTSSNHITVSRAGSRNGRFLRLLLLGVPRRGVVAVSAVGVNLDTGTRQVGNGPLEYRLFVDGFREMVRRWEPSLVLAYGRLPAACHELVEVVAYPTRWTGIRAARQWGVSR